jgi:NitT/TauT family transport system permease protein
MHQPLAPDHAARLSVSASHARSGHGFFRKLLEPRAPIPRPVAVAAALLGFGIFLLLWTATSAHFEHQHKAVLLPSPRRVADAMADYFGYGPRTQARIEEMRAAATPGDPTIPEQEREIRASARADLGTLWLDVRVSFLRVTCAFLLAAALGIPIGILMGSFRVFESLLQPITEFIRYVPVPALIPLLIVFFGIEETPKIMLIFIGTFFQLVLMVADSIRRVPVNLLSACYVLGGTRLEAVTRVLVPAAGPGIFDTLRICNGWAWTWLIVAELVAADAGLGFRIVKYQRFLLTDRIFIYLLILGCIGLLMDLFFRAIHRTFFPWADPARRS